MAKAEEVKWAVDGSITDEALEKQRSRIGKKFQVQGLNTESCRDNIRRFVDGIGDPNPLWRDEEYAKKTRYGSLVAPSSFLFSISWGGVMLGMAGVHAFHSGNDWEFYLPILPDYKIICDCTFAGFDEKFSDFAPRWLVEKWDTLYSNQKGDLLAKTRAYCVRAERTGMEKKGKYSYIQVPHPWTAEERRKIIEESLAVPVRGPEVRYWEDVVVGEELPTLIKGPITMSDEVAFMMGTNAGRFEANEVAWRTFQKIPGYSMYHPESNADEFIEMVHVLNDAGRTTGLPGAYDFGAQRYSWVMQSVTHWIGDEGWLKKTSALYRKFLYLGDVARISGKVTKKYIDEDGEYCVDIESHCINQRNEDAVPANSTVVLPSREKGIWPLDRRVSKK